MIVKLKYIGSDSWSRPVYEDEDGRLWKDVDPRKHREPDLCTSMYNALEGEPDTNMCYIDKYKDAEIVFLDGRITWW